MAGGPEAGLQSALATGRAGPQQRAFCFSLRCFSLTFLRCASVTFSTIATVSVLNRAAVRRSSGQGLHTAVVDGFLRGHKPL